MKYIYNLFLFFSVFVFAVNSYAQDTDGDNIINSIDLDDDNDGILDSSECQSSDRIANGVFPTSGSLTGWTTSGS